jgi:pimeloyl-ACP methyl ester carboxylesterase
MRNRLVNLLFLASIALRANALAAVQDTSSLAGHWEGAATLNGKVFRLAFDFDPGIESAGNSNSVLVDYPDLPLYAMPFTLAATADDLRIERHPANGPLTRIEGAPAGDTFTGKFYGAGAKDAQLQLQRVSPSAHVLRQEDVRFVNGEVALAGTIIFPDGPAPYPAVVVTHGSDPDTRDAAAYRSRGALFAQHGVAALIYDKRGLGASTGDYTDAGIDDLAKDAVAGVELLKTRRDIERGHIGVAGHSQGGWIAPLAATLSRDVAFVYVQSAAGMSPMVQSLYHNANEMRAAGFGETDIARAQELRDRLYAQVRSGNADSRLPVDLEAASKEPWFAASKLPYPLSDTISDGERRLLMFEPLPVWRQVHVPVLAIWGERDVNLPAETSRELIVAALERGGNRDVETRILPGLTHSLIRERKVNDAWDFPRGSAEYEPLIADWIARKVAQHAPPK